jgi:GNAT superfamily N-acetyltransferase
MGVNPAKENRLTMIRQSLQAIPDFKLPAGFKLRWYVAGDEALWLEIHLKADRFNPITPELFQQQFGTDTEQLKKRQCYLLSPDDKAIGTATAWYGKDPEVKEFGRVHWVALLPEYQGRGLSKPLLSAVCNRMRELGHTQAYLTTSVERKAAIGSYLRFGFKPWIRNEDEQAIWAQLAGAGQGSVVP